MAIFRTNLKTVLATAGAIAVATALALSVSTAGYAQGAHEAREKLMKSMGGNMKELGAAVGSGDMTQVAALATEIGELAEQIPARFEEKGMTEEGRAKPEIWENFADFEAKAEDLHTAAMGVAEKAKAGTLPNDPKAVAGMIGGACGACHKQYRAPEKS